MKNQFEIIGYMEDYYIGLKYIGSINSKEQPGREFSYGGRHRYILSEDIVLNNKKRIKGGTEVMTQLIPLCGKWLGGK